MILLAVTHIYNAVAFGRQIDNVLFERGFHEKFIYDFWTFELNFSIRSFFPVIAKNCNSKPAQVLNGERIFIDDSQQILGFGFSDQNCRLVDFTSYVIVSSSNADENIQAACAIGRKSTCTTDIGAYKGPNFQTAIIGPHSLHLQNVEGDCTDLSFQF